MNSVKPQWAIDFVDETAAALQVSDSFVWALGAFAGLLVVFAIGVVFQVTMISREKKMSLKSTLGYIANSFWAIPVLAMLAFFTFRVATAGQPTRPPAKTNQFLSYEEQQSGVELAFHPTGKASGWTERTPERAGRGGELKSIVLSARGAHVEDAERKLVKQTRDLLSQEFPKQFGEMNFGRLNAKTIKRHLVEKVEEQPGVETVGTYRNDATQVYWKLNLNQENRIHLREAVVTPRLWILGGVFGLLTIIVVALAGYFRLDAKTEGRYRFRLKLATTSLIVGTGIVLTAMLPLA